MKALIFAAGLGERMRPLTSHTPKPLLEAGGKPLIAWHLDRLAAAGITDVVINTSWLSEQFPRVLGDGDRWGMRLHFAHEGPTPLETGGGMLHALDVLLSGGARSFVAINGDIHCDYDLARLPGVPSGEAHLVMVDNPSQHPGGDFALVDGLLQADRAPRLTFSGIGVYRPSLLSDWQSVIGDAPGAESSPPRFKLAPLLRAAIDKGAVTGEHHGGHWTDVGTPQRLDELNQRLRAGP